MFKNGCLNGQYQDRSKQIYFYLGGHDNGHCDHQSPDLSQVENQESTQLQPSWAYIELVLECACTVTRQRMHSDTPHSYYSYCGLESNQFSSQVKKKETKIIRCIWVSPDRQAEIKAYSNFVVSSWSFCFRICHMFHTRHWYFSCELVLSYGFSSVLTVYQAYIVLLSRLSTTLPYLSFSLHNLPLLKFYVLRGILFSGT